MRARLAMVASSSWLASTAIGGWRTGKARRQLPSRSSVAMKRLASSRIIRSLTTPIAIWVFNSDSAPMQRQAAGFASTIPWIAASGRCSTSLSRPAESPTRRGRPDSAGPLADPDTGLHQMGEERPFVAGRDGDAHRAADEAIDAAGRIADRIDAGSGGESVAARSAPARPAGTRLASATASPHAKPVRAPSRWWP